jgi:hypothetical protein
LATGARSKGNVCSVNEVMSMYKVIMESGRTLMVHKSTAVRLAETGRNYGMKIVVVAPNGVKFTVK